MHFIKFLFRKIGCLHEVNKIMVRNLHLWSDFREREQKSRIFFGQYHTKRTMLHEMRSAYGATGLLSFP